MMHKALERSQQVRIRLAAARAQDEGLPRPLLLPSLESLTSRA
jgi:hypothetical protein